LFTFGSHLLASYLLEAFASLHSFHRLLRMTENSVKSKKSREIIVDEIQRDLTT